MLADYNSYGVSAAKYPYMLNQTFPASGMNDFMTTDMLATEFYLLNGTDITFLPRELYKEDTAFGEYLSPVFEKGFPLRMFLEEVEAWSGNGDMYSKFGLQVTDEATLYINKSSFLAQTENNYPKQDDLIYVAKSKKLFQIKHIEDEVQPAFYLLGQRAGFKFSCGLFSYNHEKISQSVSGEDNGIPLAIQALDSLLSDLDGNQVTLDQKEYNLNNAPIINNAVNIIDTREVDPLG
jgi:hypothetical protein